MEFKQQNVIFLLGNLKSSISVAETFNLIQNWEPFKELERSIFNIIFNDPFLQQIFYYLLYATEAT